MPRKSDPEEHMEKADSEDASSANPFAAYLEAFDPSAILKANFDMYRSFAEIALGTSLIKPDARDGRFKDETWSTNPYYKRLSQAYLAMCDAVEKMIPEDLPWEDKARAELAVSIVTSTLAPTNTLAGNPAALRRTVETRGSNLATGFKAFLKDMKDNGGMPSQVDDSGFEVGRNMAVTPGKIVHRAPMFELIQYAPATAQVHEIPTLLVPPQIGRYYFADLSPGRSFAEYAVSQGIQYFTISWKNPTADDRAFGLDDYAKVVLDAMDIIAEITDQPKINMLGFCAGGILSTMVASYLARTGSDRVNSLTLCVAMLNFKIDASLGAFRLPTMLTVAKVQSEMRGVLQGSDLGKIFTWLRPNDLVWNYWVNNYLMGDAPPAFDILAWNKDSSNMTAQLHKDFLELFEGNMLVEEGAYELLGEPVEIDNVTCDSFVVGAVTDHLTPWKACYQSGRLLGSKNSTFALSNGGHIAALVNPPGNPKAYHYLGKADEVDADVWQEKTGKVSGSWWESWTDWSAKRSGKKKAAPKTLGSKMHKSIADAPGEYVRN